jgi:hypothetical protein
MTTAHLLPQSEARKQSESKPDVGGQAKEKPLACGQDEAEGISKSVDADVDSMLSPPRERPIASSSLPPFWYAPHVDAPVPSNQDRPPQLRS